MGNLVLENADLPRVATAAPIRRVSQTVSLPKVDGRSTLGKLMRQVRADLIRHVGGRPSATQTMLIERAVTLTGYQCDAHYAREILLEKLSLATAPT
jgi:hypothetical protein